MQTFYVYDPVTFDYAGKVQCKNQPENATAKAPFVTLNGVAYPLSNPKFDKAKDEWQGNNSQYDMRKTVSGLSEQVANLSESVNLLMDSLTSSTTTSK